MGDWRTYESDNWVPAHVIGLWGYTPLTPIQGDIYTYCSTGNKDYQQASGHPHSIPLCARVSLPPKHSRTDWLWALAPKYNLISYHHSHTHYTNPFPLPHFTYQQKP